jgi:PAS domain S-box-containing protein
MDDNSERESQLLLEINELRRRLAELESADSARKKAEEALLKSEERFRTFASHTYDWECWHDADGKLLYTSPSCYRMTGYQPEEFYSDLNGMLKKLIHPEDHAITSEHVREAVAGPETPLRLVHRFVRRDGRIRWIEHFCQSVYDSNGKYAGRRSCNRDITEQKRAEDLLQKANREMERRIEERTAELTETVEQLHNEIQERIRAESALQRERKTLEHLLRSSDHERQLIAYEIHDGLAQFLAGAIMQFQGSEYAKAEDPDQSAICFNAGMEMLRHAHSEARRLISGVRPPILDDSGIVAAIAHLAGDQGSSGGMKIEFRSRVEFERLDSIVENAIFRIVQECLANACKHSGSESARIELAQSDRHLRIEIQDWGKGFTVDEAGDGCYGLEGVRERVRLLGGSVEIQSAPGAGTRITVELPLLPTKSRDSFPIRSMKAPGG